MLLEGNCKHNSITELDPAESAVRMLPMLELPLLRRREEVCATSKRLPGWLAESVAT